MFTVIFWKAAAERAVKSFAQALAATLGAAGIAFQDVDWRLALSVAGMTALLSVLTSLSSVNVGDAGTPSLVSRTPHAPDAAPDVADAGPVPEPRLART